MKSFRAFLTAFVLASGTALMANIALPLTGIAQASELKYVVNGIPITSYDISKREALLRLQRKSGNIRQQAIDDMIDQALRESEMRRLRINVSDSEVNAAFGRFSKSNKMSSSQMADILGRAGVTADHFKAFIHSQIGWSRVLRARFQSTGRMTEQEAVQRMLQNGGEKPTATEYMLQQVIFVVPDRDRNSLLSRREREAQSLRNRFQGCDSTRDFAKGLLDVTVRDLGRVLAPELPPEWAKEIKATKPGNATPIKKTSRGVEFIGICSAREVSDDTVAQMVFKSEDSSNKQSEDQSAQYLKELREKAQISKR
jgi:peptidyl-prolyl cis-trans isomerase SurA